MLCCIVAALVFSGCYNDFDEADTKGYTVTATGIAEPNTTIYAVGFLEGGNAWHDTKDFSPFSIRRSAGVGVRIMLPMVGLMGIDWGYGFDKEIFGEKAGGSHFHFVLGQEF